MEILELCDFKDVRFTECFRRYFLEIGIRLKDDTDVFDEIAKSCEKENMRAFVLGEDQAFTGFIMFQPELLKGGFFEERLGFIRELWVDPSYRHLGYGRRLIETAEKHFREEKIAKLILTYEEEAIGFYRKLGFVHDRSYCAENGGNIVIKHIPVPACNFPESENKSCEMAQLVI